MDTGITLFELIQHFVLVTISIVVLIVMLAVRQRLVHGPCRKAIILLLTAIALSTFRWIGGSLARLDVAWMNNPVVLFIWTMTGVIAGALAIYGAAVAVMTSRLNRADGVRKRIAKKR